MIQSAFPETAIERNLSSLGSWHAMTCDDDLLGEAVVPFNKIDALVQGDIFSEFIAAQHVEQLSDGVLGDQGDSMGSDVVENPLELPVRPYREAEVSMTTRIRGHFSKISTGRHGFLRSFRLPRRWPEAAERLLSDLDGR